MSHNVNALVTELESLRLPQLKERYEQVLGTSTRCPNRTFLIRSICSAVRTQAEQAAAVKQGEAPSPAEEPRVAPTVTNVAPSAADAEAAPTAPPDAPNGATGRQRRPRPDRPPRGRFSSMTIEERQAMYLATVGRPSSSSHRGYLQWKIREAERGRINVGPRKASAIAHGPGCLRVLPLRLDVSTIERMDEAWRSRGIKSRTEFLRGAIGHYLERLGASEEPQPNALVG